MRTIKRREFIKVGVACAGVAASGSLAFCKSKLEVPSYLKGYEGLYAKDPRQAALTWFKEAKFGLFMHYGLYSLLEGHYNGRHSKPAEWALRRTDITPTDYEKLKDTFTAENFDPDFITDMVLDAEMKYINITTRHHDSFSLWDTNVSDYKSTNAAAKRDLVGELAEQCQQKGLGFCLYYSHGRDWRHPDAPESMVGEEPAVAGQNPDRTKKGSLRQGADIDKYVEFMNKQITELLTNYGPIAAIWLDGIAAADKLKPHTQQLYDMIHRLQPQVLVSYKHGLLGTEDFMAPERHFDGAPTKPLELCNTMQGYSWGYDSADEGRHRGPDEVMAMLKQAGELPANLLLNTGPLPDGSIHPDDVKTLKEVGRRLRAG
jgi:alpha-L-fucosidase